MGKSHGQILLSLKTCRHLHLWILRFWHISRIFETTKKEYGICLPSKPTTPPAGTTNGPSTTTQMPAGIDYEISSHYLYANYALLLLLILQRYARRQSLTRLLGNQRACWENQNALGIHWTPLLVSQIHWQRHMDECGKAKTQT